MTVAEPLTSIADVRSRSVAPRWDAVVKRHISELKRGSPVRECADGILAGAELTSEDCSTLLSALTTESSAQWRERFVAASCLGASPPPPEWIARVRDGLRRVLRIDEFLDPAGRLHRACTLTLRAVVIVTVVVITAHLATTGLEFPPLLEILGASIALYLLLIAPVVIASGVAEDKWISLAQAAAARSLGHLADPLAARLVAKAIRGPWVEVRQAAEYALPSVLAAMQPEHYGMLPPEATTTLCQLMWESSPEQAGRILDALGRAGAGAAAESVRRFAAQSLSNENRKAAERILPVLEERLRNETATARLLRPAESPENPAEVLLRPVGSATAVPEEQLLRAAAAEEIVRAEHIE